LQFLTEARPDAILLDIGMPDMDGYELCRRFRANPVTQSTPIIARTGYALPTDLERARDAGFSAVLIKPCAPDRVVLEIQRLLPLDFDPTA
jgi:CheY-like chemotaxis protein